MKIKALALSILTLSMALEVFADTQAEKSILMQETPLVLRDQSCISKNSHSTKIKSQDGLICLARDAGLIDAINGGEVQSLEPEKYDVQAVIIDGQAALRIIAKNGFADRKSFKKGSYKVKLEVPAALSFNGSDIE